MHHADRNQIVIEVNFVISGERARQTEALIGPMAAMVVCFGDLF
jgi:hypothetical protein